MRDGPASAARVLALARAAVPAAAAEETGTSAEVGAHVDFRASDELRGRDTPGRGQRAFVGIRFCIHWGAAAAFPRKE